MTTTTTATSPATAAAFKVRSADGTVIAGRRSGCGPALVVVDGAFCSTTMGPGKDLAPALSQRFTVYTYDRRGRGGSGDTAPYAVDREVEDLAAVIAGAGGAALVLGHSSGASLALEAARQGLPITRLALYEAPMVVDDTRPPVGEDYLARLSALIEDGRRGAAVRLFMTEGVRVPVAMVALMSLMVPMWRRLKAVAHTVVYDTIIVNEDLKGRPLPAGRWSGVTVPVLVIDGGKSPAWMRNAMRSLAQVLPAARYVTLPGQTHMVRPAATAPVVTGFFAGGDA